MSESKKNKMTIKVYPIKKLRNLFLTHLIIGVIAIVFFTYSTTSNYLYSIASSLIVMVLYFGFSIRYVQNIPADTVGDSNYYLGFIFTLLALVLTLIFRFQEIDGEELKVVGLIQEFGVAMITTLVGLVARIFISQFSITPDEADQDTRHKIAESVSRLATQLKLAEENLQITVNNQQNRITQFVSSSTNIVKEFFTEQSKAFKETSDDYRNALADNSSELKKQTNQLNSTFQKITNSTEDFYSSLNKISLSMETLETSVTNINKIASDKDFQNKINEFNKNLDKLNEKLNTMNSAIENSKKSVEGDLAFIQQQRNELKTASTEATESLKLIQNNLTSLSKFIIDKLS